MRARRLIAALFALAGAAAALGAEGPCGTPDNFRELQRTLLASRGADTALQAARNCLGDPVSDGHPLVVAFNKATPQTDSASDRTAAIVSALSRLRDAAAARQQQGVDALAWQQVVGEINREIDAARAAEQKQSAHPIDASFWEMPRQPGPTVLNGAIEPFRTGCTDVAAPCPGYDSRIDLIRIMNLMFRLIGYADYPNLMAHFADARLMNDRWEGYFHNALPQYWWEVALNGSLMGSKLCPRDATGMRLGFCAVPESQLILLHPASALQWVDGAHGKDDLAPAFVVELFGRNAWSWHDKDAVLHGQFGWSVITAYGNSHGDGKKWSYGLMVHKGASMNLGVTTPDLKRYSLLVSVNLAEWIFARKAQYLDYLKALQKPGIDALL